MSVDWNEDGNVTSQYSFVKGDISQVAFLYTGMKTTWSVYFCHTAQELYGIGSRTKGARVMLTQMHAAVLLHADLPLTKKWYARTINSVKND